MFAWHVVAQPLNVEDLFSRAALACVTRAREHSHRVWCERSMKDLMWTRPVAHESDVSAGERKLSLECVVRKEGGDIDPSASGFRDWWVESTVGGLQQINVTWTQRLLWHLKLRTTIFKQVALSYIPWWWSWSDLPRRLVDQSSRGARNESLELDWTRRFNGDELKWNRFNGAEEDFGGFYSVKF